MALRFSLFRVIASAFFLCALPSASFAFPDPAAPTIDDRLQAAQRNLDAFRSSLAGNRQVTKWADFLRDLNTFEKSYLSRAFGYRDAIQALQSGPDRAGIGQMIAAADAEEKAARAAEAKLRDWMNRNLTRLPTGDPKIADAKREMQEYHAQFEEIHYYRTTLASALYQGPASAIDFANGEVEKYLLRGPEALAAMTAKYLPPKPGAAPKPLLPSSPSVSGPTADAMKKKYYIVPDASGFPSDAALLGRLYPGIPAYVPFYVPPLISPVRLPFLPAPAVPLLR